MGKARCQEKTGYTQLIRKEIVHKRLQYRTGCSCEAENQERVSRVTAEKSFLMIEPEGQGKKKKTFLHDSGRSS